MAKTSYYHPTELAYVLSYMRVKSIIGWGPEPFTPPPGLEDPFYADGLARLQRTARLVPGKQPGRYRFAEETSQIAATLSDPSIVFVTHRKEGDGVRIMTHHVAKTHVVELTLGKDGEFQVVEYDSLAGAAGAAAAFVGASMVPVEKPLQLLANEKVFKRIKELAKGQAPLALAGLIKLGADEASARSIVAAFSAPLAAGVISVLYCVGNAAQDADVYSVVTNADDETWVLFPPETADGPVVLERSSVSALAARILVTVTARMVLPAEAAT